MGITADADWGMAFRGSPGGNHYSWQYVNSGLMFVAYVAGARAENNLKGQGEILNEWQDFKVVAAGNSFELSWKGDIIAEFSHNSFKTGKVGLFAWDVADFDDFTVTADSLAGQAVSSIGSLATAWGSIKVK